MKSKPRCKKCGRVLRNPISIARGMGPICAGDTGRSGRRPQVHARRSSGRTYDAIGSGSLQSPLPVQLSEKPESKLAKRERIRRIRTQRKTHFLAREPVQIGVSTRTREPVIYNPVGTDNWMDNQGRKVSHEFLENYLVRYQFI